MKKLFALLLALAMLVALASCVKGEDESKAPVSEPASAEQSETPEVSEPASAEQPETVMTYAEYAAAEIDSKVVVETYVQAKQSWWEKDGVGVGTFYTQDENGGYFLYDMPCSKEEYDALVKGTKIKVTGTKAEWSGEVEIIDATFVVEDGTYEAPAADVTELIGKEGLAEKMNTFIAVKGATVEAIGQDSEGNDTAWFYKWNNSGAEGDDLYFKVNVNGTSLTLVVESYLCGPDTDVYKAVKELKVGDKIDLEAFLYWYEGAQPHVTNITK